MNSSISHQHNQHILQKHTWITLERVEKFMSDTFWTRSNLWGNRFPFTSQKSVELSTFAATDRISFEEAIQHSFQPTNIGASFGPSWSTHWFHVKITLPSEIQWKDQVVAFIWDSDSEALLWSTEGKPLQAFTGGYGLDRRAEYILTNSASPGEHYEFYVEMACNGMFGNGANGQINPPDPDRYFTLKQAQVSVVDLKVFQVLWDLKVIYEMAKDLPQDSPRANQALFTANQMVTICGQLQDRSPSVDSENDPLTQAHFLATEFFSEKNGDSQINISAIGHCHIDVAWLWPYAETRRKSGRSFCTQLKLMNENKNFKFTQSQAQLYEWVQEDYPSIFSQIKEKAEQGQWIPIGGTWVEMDGNLPSGESMARQFLYGQRFFKHHFGSYCTEFWLPDTFGYSAQLPQIINQSHITSFLTQKLSWNLINKFPHHSFKWRGINYDSCVLTHFPPSDNYNNNMTVGEISMCASNFKDKDRSRETMVLFGHGDGGGGPNPEMLERMERMHDVDGLPRIECRTPNQFFNRLDDDADKLCEWEGELYFELHRGTYTSQAPTKKGNRKSELLLRDVEILSIFDGMSQSSINFKFYPIDKLTQLWKFVCLNQFHDVLPGSSIGMVYDDAVKYYDHILDEGSHLKTEALHRLVSNGNNNDNSVIAFNTLGWNRTEVVEIPKSKNSQQNTADDKLSLAILQAPSIGYQNNDITDSIQSRVSAQYLSDKNIYRLENEYVRVDISNQNGTILSMWDKRARREAIEQRSFKKSELQEEISGKGNRFVLYDDTCLFWDAWDTEIFHLETGRYLSKQDYQVKLTESGPLRASVTVSCSNLVPSKANPPSTLFQTIALSAVSSRLDFHTQVEWHETYKFLKVEFPTTIRSSDASYDIQFGHVRRPTHKNTSWDFAKFEVCGHKWADLSEYGFGVSVMNDCKYGYATEGNVIRLSLLRSPKAPDDKCDMGLHEFTYSLYPHPHNLQDGGVIQEAYQLNVPLSIHPFRKIPSLASPCSMFSVSTSQVVLESIKRAEDCPNAIVLRLYEAFGGHASEVKVRSAKKPRSVKPCSLLEETDFEPNRIGSIQPCPLSSNTSSNIQEGGSQEQEQEEQDSVIASINLTPFQIMSLLIEY